MKSLRPKHYQNTWIVWEFEWERLCNRCIDLKIGFSFKPKIGSSTKRIQWQTFHKISNTMNLVLIDRFHYSQQAVIINIFNVSTTMNGKCVVALDSNGFVSINEVRKLIVIESSIPLAIEYKSKAISQLAQFKIKTCSLASNLVSWLQTTLSDGDMTHPLWL